MHCGMRKEVQPEHSRLQLLPRGQEARQAWWPARLAFSPWGAGACSPPQDQTCFFSQEGMTAWGICDRVSGERELPGARAVRGAVVEKGIAV